MSAEMDKTRMAMGALELRDTEENLRKVLDDQDVGTEEERVAWLRNHMLPIETRYLEQVQVFLDAGVVTLLDFYHAVRDPEEMLSAE